MNSPTLDAHAARRSDLGTVDLMASPALEAFFEARERYAYYRSLKDNADRHHDHEALVGALERFIEATEDGTVRAAVDAALQARAARPPAPRRSDVLAKAGAVCPRGVALLAVEAPVTFASIKRAYRAAAQRHHPDLGGDHVDMVAVNDAYGLLHDLLFDAYAAAAEEPEEASSADAIATCDDFRYGCGELLVRAHLLDWDPELAAHWIGRITSADWQRSAYASHPDRRVRLVAPCGDMAMKFASAGRLREAREALVIAEEPLRLATARGLRYDHHLSRARTVLDGGKASRPAVKHPRQAANAMRLGAIDRKALVKVVQKHDDAAAERDARERAVSRFVAETGFLHGLPTDRLARKKRIRGALVPVPDYGEAWISKLSNDQQAEYSTAFAGGGRLDLARKYLFVRLVSLLESVALHPGKADEAAAAREALAIGRLHDGSGPAHAAAVAAAIDELSSEPAEAREERAALLAKFERSDDEEYTIDENFKWHKTLALGMPLSEEYMETLSRPVEELRAMVHPKKRKLPKGNGRLPRRTEPDP